MEAVEVEPIGAAARQSFALDSPKLLLKSNTWPTVRPVVWFVAVLVLALVLRADRLGDTPPVGDEAESAMNAMTILDHGVPTGTYLDLPIYENTLTEPWPGNPEYEFRDSSYSSRGLAIYHGWLPLYSMAASFKFFGVQPDQPTATLHVQHTAEEMQRRTMAARAPSVLFGLLFVVFAFLAAKEMCGLDAAWAAMLVAAIGDPFIFFAREARYHSATVAISTGCCWILWRTSRNRTWGNFIAAALLLIAMFHTHLISFVTVCAAACLLLPMAIRDRSAWIKLTVAAAVVAVGTVPWILLTGFIGQTTHIPPARTFLSYPADLFIFPLKKMPQAIPGIVALAGVLLVELFPSRFPRRMVRLIRSHRAAIYFLLAWVLIGFAIFTFLIPAASYFYKRMALGFLGPGLVFGAILFALIIRAIWPRRSNWLAPLAFLLAVVVCGEAFLPWWDSYEPNGTLEAVQWLSTHDLPADTKLYCTPNDQLTLTFLTGLPVQSVAPIRKTFIDTYPGRMIVIESSPPYQQLQLDDIVRIAGQSGAKLSWMDAWKLQAPLSTRLQRIELASRCGQVDPPLEPSQPFTDAIVAFQREYTMRRQQHWMDNGANNPVMRGFDIPNFASWWPIFFYRFVDPLSRSGPHLNYADRIRSAHADVTPSGWVIFDCPPLAASRTGKAPS